MSSKSPPSDADGSAQLRQRRFSDTLTSAIHAVEEKVSHSLLLLWDEIPSWRRDNAFIRSGYRQSRGSYLHSFNSLFYLHNEFVNIWSHLIGALISIGTGVYLYWVIQPRYESATSSDVLVFACFLGGAVTCLGMSATFHALADHSASVAAWGNKLDYTGIVVLIVGSYIPTLYYGFFCKPALMAGYMNLIFLLGIGCIVVSWVDKFRSPDFRVYRALMFIGLGVSGVIPIGHGLITDGYQYLEEMMSLSWVILQGGLYIFGAGLYAARWPERSFPGAFDIWGSSHQIFHMFVLFAAGTHFWGMAKAFDHHHTVMFSQCPI